MDTVLYTVLSIKTALLRDNVLYKSVQKQNVAYRHPCYVTMYTVIVCYVLLLYTVTSVANWYIYIPDFTNLVYFLDRLVGEIMVWYMSLNLVYFYAFW